MSDDIPFDIQTEVIKLLPIKSLIKFVSVSKRWKSVIESSDFIADYTIRFRDQPHHLLIRYQNKPSSEHVYVSIADNDTDTLLHNNKFSITVVPPAVNLLRDTKVIGTSSGVFCLLGYYQTPCISSLRNVAVLWNPSIRKSVAIAVPDDVILPSAFGFGVCPATSDPKFVKIIKSVTWQVEVFNLSSGVWRISPCNPPDKLVEFESPQSNIDRFIYWLGVTSDAGTVTIISFDLLSEEFGEIHLPPTLAYADPIELFLFKRGDSLEILKLGLVDIIYEVWMMENGFSKSFTMLFTVSLPNEFIGTISLPLEFRMNGEIMMAKVGTDDSEQLVVYDPLSEHINDIGIKAQNISLLVISYTESLILLDQKDTLSDEETSI